MLARMHRGGTLTEGITKTHKKTKYWFPLPKFKDLFALKVRVTERNGNTEEENPPFPGSLCRWPQWTGLGQAEARSYFQFSHLGKWEAFTKHLDHPLLFFPGHQHGGGLEVEQPRHKLATIWDSGVIFAMLQCRPSISKNACPNIF